jgi:hypothetical protein
MPASSPRKSWQRLFWPRHFWARRFWQLSGPDRRLVIEATLALTAASLAIPILPFRVVARLAAHPLRQPEMSGVARAETVRRTRWAVVACARRLPWSAVCFQQGLAAQWMLRRRGVAAVLYYGAAIDAEAGPSSHVWVRDGDIDVVGGEVAARFAVLARFPACTSKNANRIKHLDCRDKPGTTTRIGRKQRQLILTRL